MSPISVSSGVETAHPFGAPKFFVEFALLNL